MFLPAPMRLKTVCEKSFWKQCREADNRLPPRGALVHIKSCRRFFSGGRTVEAHREVERILRAGSHFEVLELAPLATSSGARGIGGAVHARCSGSSHLPDAKRSFQRIVKLVHPDVCSHLRARDAFEKVTKAHEVLRSPAR